MITLKDFLSKVDSPNGNLDHQIVIKTNKPSVGPLSCEQISGVHFGFDWDKGKIFLYPENPLVPKSQSESIYDLASDLIFYIATKPMKNHSYEKRCAIRVLNGLGIDQQKLDSYIKIFHKK